MNVSDNAAQTFRLSLLELRVARLRRNRERRAGLCVQDGYDDDDDGASPKDAARPRQNRQGLRGCVNHGGDDDGDDGLDEEENFIREEENLTVCLPWRTARARARASTCSFTLMDLRD